MTIFAIVLGLMSLLVGVPKLLGVEQLRKNLAELGLGPGPMRAIGALEVAAAVGLQIDSLEVAAAGGMVLMMIGAIAAHARAKQAVQEFVPSVVFLVLMGLFVILSL